MIPSIQESPRYFTEQNFMGRRMPGYECGNLIFSREAAAALAKVQEDLLQSGYSLVIYDSYRPQRTVDSFVQWSNDDSDVKMKELYYPTLVGSKKQLFDDGYIAAKSGHTRGSTVDLSIIEVGKKVQSTVTVSKRTLVNGTEISFLDDGTVDMGSSFDLFHPASHHDSPYITDPIYISRRQLLREAMMRHGFKDLAEEWWHYRLADEPFPTTYFDFVTTCPAVAE